MVRRISGCEVANLQEELQEAFDSTPDGLQDSEVGQARALAANQLECIADNMPLVPEALSDLRVVHCPLLNLSSRCLRVGNAIDKLRTAKLAAQRYIESAKLTKAQLKEIQGFCNQLEAHVDEIGDVEFPGMFG